MRNTPENIARLRPLWSKIFNQQSPSFVISPLSAHLQHSPRQTLAHKPAAPDKRNRCRVSRLNIRFEAMQLQRSKSIFQHQPHPFAHQTLSGVWRKSVIPQRTALECPTNNLIDIDHSHNRARASPNEQKSEIPIRGKPFQIGRKFLACSRLGGNPRTMQRATALYCLNKFFAISSRGRPDEHSRFWGGWQTLLGKSIPPASRKRHLMRKNHPQDRPQKKDSKRSE